MDISSMYATVDNITYPNLEQQSNITTNAMKNGMNTIKILENIIQILIEMMLQWIISNF